jgi:hypothetical protein
VALAEGASPTVVVMPMTRAVTSPHEDADQDTVLTLVVMVEPSRRRWRASGEKVRMR